MRELSTALAQMGFQTDLYFVGDPNLPGEETQEDGKLTLHRWCQWISEHHPGGVYAGEPGKVEDFSNSVPRHVIETIVAPAAEERKLVIVMAEEWHTAGATINLSDLLFEWGLRNRVILLWNANNLFGFWNIPWMRLDFVSTITTVSRFMKQQMWDYGVNPIVVPNGIPNRLLTPPQGDPKAIREKFSDRLILAKVARFDPDKRWLQAIHAVAGLKHLGLPVRFFMRGGVEAHGADVLWTASQLGLQVVDVYAEGRPSVDECLEILSRHADADILNLKFFLPEEFLRLLYNAADAVLANSGLEPFGLVGLEVMAEGGVAVTGATGEDYARTFENALCIETEDPREIVSGIAHLKAHPELELKLRKAARETAESYTWDAVIDGLLPRLEMLAFNQGLTDWAGLPTGTGDQGSEAG
jgi:glycosyltransferase involved in cell wall biosynthesis